jgi:hypothetical protein
MKIADIIILPFLELPLGLEKEDAPIGRSFDETFECNLYSQRKKFLGYVYIYISCLATQSLST